MIEDGTTQLWQYERNALLYVTRAVDPLGRETLTEYAANGIDVDTDQGPSGVVGRRF